MNINPLDNVQVRVGTYVASTIVGLIPASLAGYVHFDLATWVMMVEVKGLLVAVFTGLGGSFAVFAKWGVK